MKIHNPNCDGSHCTSKTGEVRRLPLSSDPNHGALILCRSCYHNEIAWRRERNLELQKVSSSDRLELPAWGQLEIYATSSEEQ